MFENSIFTSQFWEWFIIIPTVGGILGCFALIIWLGSDSSSKSDDKEVKTMGHVWDEDLAEYNNPLPRWWLNMFYITLVIASIYLILYPGLGSYAGLLGWTELKQYEQEMEDADNRYGLIYAKYAKEPIAELAKRPDAVRLGKSLFMTYCTVCHGSDAGGVPGYPNLRDNDWLWGGTPEAIKTSITHGRKGNMPDAETNNLNSDADIDNVVEYVLSLSGKKHEEAAAVKGKEAFNKVCFACHGTDGKGNQMLGAPNLTDDIWLYGSSKATITETITKGRQNIMPAHGEFLGEDKIHLLASYIYSFSLNK
ncbi:cytochrome-c oxidase, cbb3-type subunit III [Candidatus Marithrix sp. Canyon 246]|uniref:cytochrome-c oxidase, cbb3-type subunit III n=1 Tax=Candidatus Marithrix sp. Canyon 246 TaxID=1827136 RepID=UPI00084A23AA|nr:cytochrome-c oxidase, cbb3-type subunit III [Candidatus Marithrix sp. Canyon 246]